MNDPMPGWEVRDSQGQLVPKDELVVERGPQYTLVTSTIQHEPGERCACAAGIALRNGDRLEIAHVAPRHEARPIVSGIEP